MRDPQQMFYVKPPLCQNVRVTVVRALNIRRPQTNATPESDGKLRQVLSSGLPDTPDSYVILRLQNRPKQKKQTKMINNDQNPVWNEILEFYIDANSENVMEIILMDDNYLEDECFGIQTCTLNTIPLNLEVDLNFTFNEDTKLEMKIYRTNDDITPGLRFSAELCEEEKTFIEKRKAKVFESLLKLLGDEKGPKTLNDVPTIGVLGSGGGFRAMVSMTGFVKALHKTGLLDCTTYVAGLSGSTWYLSTLYSEPNYPHPATPHDCETELRSDIEKGPLTRISTKIIYSYLEEVLNKRNTGQYVSFTDLFGLLLRDTLLSTRPQSTLSYQREKLKEATVPLPLYSCLHVKNDVQARVYSEWMEFSPYEVGLAKYGTFMKPEHFGCNFYLGRVQKTFPEAPLHFLQGIWGSAFCMVYQQMDWTNQTLTADDFNRIMCEASQTDENDKDLHDYKVTDKGDPNQTDQNAEANGPIVAAVNSAEDFGKDARLALKKNADYLTNMAQRHLQKAVKRGLDTMSMIQNMHREIRYKMGVNETGSEQKSLLGQVVSSAVDAITSSQLFNDISGRAACIPNPFFGTEIEPCFNKEEVTMTSPSDETTFKGLKEPLSTDDEWIYLVDAGLAFNSPFPVLLRPQRKIQLYLSFDYSARPTDNTPPFRELLLAEEWARQNEIPFPPVADIVRSRYNTPNCPVEEYYVFKDPNDEKCPIVVHYALINNKFRYYKAPGVPRVTDEEKRAGDFNLFDDKTTPYSTYNFKYTREQFDRLSDLTEFNTLLSVDEIKHVIADLIGLGSTGTRSNPIQEAVTSIQSQPGIVRRLLGFLWGLFFTGETPRTNRVAGINE